MSKYPQEFPIIEAKRLYSLVSSGQGRENIKQLAEDGWWVSGYLAKLTIGEPESFGATGEDALAELSDAEKLCLADLACLAGQTPDDLALPGEDPQGILQNIDIQKVLATFQSIVAMLKVLGILA